MKKLKKFLVLLVLVFAGVCCLSACSCSGSDGGGDTDPTAPAPSLSPSPSNPTVYSVSVNINNVDGGGYVSSTGGDTHAEFSSAVYTFTPNVGYGIETITLNGATFFTHQTSGYSQLPVSLNLSSISMNYSIDVEFKRLDFIVTTLISDENSAVLDGGTIECSAGTNNHLGGSSPVYTISPKAGYAVYELKVDGVLVFSYAENPARAIFDFVLVEQFEEISANHSIEVAFYSLIYQSDDLNNAYYYNNNSSNEFLDDVIEDSDDISVSLQLVSSCNYVLKGKPQSVKLNVNESFVLNEIAVTLDGVSYSDKFVATSNYFGDGFRYDASAKVVYFDNFTENCGVETYSTAKQVKFILFNYDTNRTDALNAISLYSYFVVNESLKDMNWYYASNANYFEPSVYMNANISETEVSPSDVRYHVFLEGNMITRFSSDVSFGDIRINAGEDVVILIYSSNKLK